MFSLCENSRLAYLFLLILDVMAVLGPGQAGRSNYSTLPVFAARYLCWQLLNLSELTV
jgi:hypothetical protein